MTPGAVSPLEISSAKAKVESDSALSNAARTNWEMEQTMQSYLQVIAPFNGVITERNVHPGALVSAEEKDGRPMLELKEVARLRLQLDIPESLAGNLKDGESITFHTSASPGKKMTGLISRKSMNINPHFRVERVEADVMNNNAELAPGMYADVIIYPTGSQTAYSVPKSSVVTSTERRYVLVVRSNRINKVDVDTGNESGDFVEVYGNLEKGDHVIVNANDEIKEGDYTAGN
jgi:RND family efflux transporter MFP subunit